MAIKVRKVKAGSKPNQFCSSCLGSEKTGKKELIQVRIRNEGCVFDFYLCEDCMTDLDNELDVLMNAL